MSLPKSGAEAHFILSDSILGLLPDSELGLCLSRWRNICISVFQSEALNEFYKKGCQEKSSASTGVGIYFSRLQPTLHRPRWSSFAFSFS